MMLEDREMCRQLGSAGACQAVGGSEGLSPATVGGPADRASRGFKASCSFHVSGPGTLSHAKQPK